MIIELTVPIDVAISLWDKLLLFVSPGVTDPGNPVGPCMLP